MMIEQGQVKPNTVYISDNVAVIFRKVYDSDYHKYEYYFEILPAQPV